MRADAGLNAVRKSDKKPFRTPPFVTSGPTTHGDDSVPSPSLPGIISKNP